MKKVKVYCGESIEDKCGKCMHPVNRVKYANEIILSNKDEEINTNDPDIVMAIKYIGLKHKVNVEFFLNGISQGDNIELIFEDFNRSFDIINELGDTTEY